MSIVKKIITFRPNFTIRIITGLIAFLMMLSVCVVVGITDQTLLNVRDAEFKARSIEAGAKVYGNQCSRCHGVEGEGVEGLGPALSNVSFVGEITIDEDAAGAQSIRTVTRSARMEQLGWTGTLKDYIKGVTAAGIPIKSSNAWDVNHPTFGQRFGGNLRDDEIENIANFVVNFGLKPLADDQAILPPAPGEGQTARPTAVPLTPEQEAGKAVYEKAGCTACHAIRGVGNQGAVGPSLNKIGSESDEIVASEDYKTKVTGQPAATTGEEYIRQSILHPGAYIYPKCPQGPCPAGVMPAIYEQQLTPEELNQLVLYLNSLGR
jgi:mono/diheme cytochrome c family protein